MKKLLWIISALIILFVGCSKDDFQGWSLPNAVHFKLNGKDFQCDSNILMANCVPNSFNIWSRSYSENAYFHIKLEEDIITGLGVGTYRFRPGKKYSGSVHINYGGLYIAGYLDEYSYCECTGYITITQYGCGFAEGTFEFASETFSPYSVTEGYFRVKM